MQVRIRYTETLKQVLGMIIIPILYMGILVAVLFSFDLDKLSEDMEFALIMGTVVLMLAASVFTIFKVIMEGGVASFDEEGLRIRLNRSTFLYPHKEFFIPFNHIEDAALDTEPGKSNFISLNTRMPSKPCLFFLKVIPILPNSMISGKGSTIRSSNITGQFPLTVQV